MSIDLAQRCQVSSIGELEQAAGIDHPQAQFAVASGRRTTPQELSALRLALEQLAMDAGYPRLPLTLADAAKFDAAAAWVLWDRLALDAFEARQSGVWEFACCVLVPHLVRWRFHSEAGTSQERFIAGRRNAFQRLWWRARAMQAPGIERTEAEQLLARIGEDEIVQIMERPTLAGAEGLPPIIAQELLRAEAAHPSLTRRQLIREAQKALMRRSTFICLDALDTSELRTLVQDCFARVSSAMEAQPA